MNEWTLADAQQRLGEVIRRAERCGPQRVAGPNADVVVLSAGEFDRFANGAGFSEPGDAACGPAMGLVEFMRTSPLAEAMAAGEISPEEWDRACRIGR